jgi:hypothetical protein
MEGENIMHCPDTLQRINDQAVDRYQVEIAAQAAKLSEVPDYNWRDDLDIVVCEYCEQPATEAIPVYNPADGLRNVTGAYDLVYTCDECRHDGSLEDDRFWCPGCGELFVTEHSWDSLGCIIDDREYCQSCAIDAIHPVTLWQVVADIDSNAIGNWPRLVDVPGKVKIWEGEYASYSDFPGHTDPGCMAGELIAKARKMGYHKGSYVYPVITHTYQFSVALAVYAG